MAVDRAACLRDAEKYLRQNRLDAAIVEYRKVVEAYPTDWNTANTLGDLYVRTNQPQPAIEQFARIAEALCAQGFLPKAAALYKKVLKIRPDDEQALLRAGEISGQQGLVADAKAYLSVVADRRRQRGDEPGVEEIERLLTSFDPDDLAARRDKARAAFRRGDAAGAIRDLKMIAAELSGRDRRMDALNVMLEALSFAPEDPDLQLALIEVRLREGNIETAIAMVRELLTRDSARWVQSVRLSSMLARDVPDAAAVLAIEVAEYLVRLNQWDDAGTVLHELEAHAPDHEALPRLRGIIERRGAEADPIASPPAESPAQPSDVEPGVDEPPTVAVSVAPAPPDPPEPSRAPDIELLGDEEQPPSASLVNESHPDDVDLSESLDDVFADMRAAAPDQLITDAADQAFARASALVSVGQLDDAMAAFEIAAAAPRRRFDASARLARMHRQRGDLDAAIAWYERAAESAAPTADAAHRVLYELADALESRGELTRALAVCLDLQAEAGDYDDLAARIERLLQPGG